MNMFKEVGLITTMILIAAFSIKMSKTIVTDENPVEVGGMIKWKL